MASDLANDPSLNYIELTIDSSIFDFGSTDQPSFNLSRIIPNVVGFQVISATIPYSFYTVNSSSQFPNALQLVINGITLNLASGNFSLTSFLNEVQTMLNGGTSSFSSVTYPTLLAANGVWTVTYVASINGARISASIGSFTILIPANTVDNNINSLTWFLGFRNSTSTDLVRTVPPGGIVGQDFATGVFPAIDLSGPNYINLRGNFSSVLYDQVRVAGQPYDQTNLICSIPLSSNPGGLIFYTNPNPSVFLKMTQNNINSLNFYFTLGINTTPINFQGLSFFIKLGFLSRFLEQ